MVSGRGAGNPHPLKFITFQKRMWSRGGKDKKLSPNSKMWIYECAWMWCAREDGRNWEMV